MRESLDPADAVPGGTGHAVGVDRSTHEDPLVLDDRAAPPPRPISIDRWLPIVAIAAMIATFLVLPPSYAMALIALIWLVGTRLNASRRLLGLTLTEALAWVATVAIVEFLSILVLVVLSGSVGA